MDDELAAIRARKLADLQARLGVAKGPKGPVTLTDATFWEEIRKAPVALVDFWAAWCAPCRYVGPVVESLAQAYEGRVLVGKLNVDENPEVATELQVHSIPTLAVFHEGKLVDVIIGVVPRATLEGALQRWL